MLGPLRTLISVAFLVLFIWGAFTVKLGSMTFADHIDRIGQTPEAQELLDGARSRVRPTLEEAKDRVLGEYVEAPTQRPEPAPSAASRERPPSPRAATLATGTPPAAASRPAPPSPARDAGVGGRPAPVRASTADAAKLPGRRKRP